MALPQGELYEKIYISNRGFSPFYAALGSKQYTHGYLLSCAICFL